MKRSGKILVQIAILLPTLCGMAGLAIDLSLLLCMSQRMRHTADSAATAAAFELRMGNSTSAARQAAESCVRDDNGHADALVTVNRPPTSGDHVGSNDHLEVIVRKPLGFFFIHLAGGPNAGYAVGRAVATCEDSTTGAAVVVLDPDPPPFQLGPIVIGLPALPALLGGFEVLGLGSVEVEGAVHVNTNWGGRDERGLVASAPAGPPYGVSAMPLLPLTKLKADDIYIVGGVDSPNNYAALSSGQPSPLKCNRLPVPDPFKDLPPPTSTSDPANVKPDHYGGKSVVGLPIIGPTVNLQPGVYEYITVVSGKAVFQPGVYIIRGKHPVTQFSLSIVTGEITANGVLFYITNNNGYEAANAGVDAFDGETEPAPVNVATLLPSVVINLGLSNGQLRGLNSPASPYHGMLIYQRRQDRRPIVLVKENLLGSADAHGAVYAKWAHLILAGKGDFDLSAAVGTMRVVALLDMTIKPQTLLPAARDVYLVE